ncbi:hypothetical protein D3C86_1653940 [compost metagenome]
MPRHQIEQGPGLERLDQVISRALAHGVDRPLHSTVRGHQQHRQLRLTRPQQPEQLMPVHARHVDVADHQIERLGFDRHQGVLGATNGFVIVTGEH